MEEVKDPTRNSLKADFYDISHSDIDSSLEMYFQETGYSFRSRKYIEVTYYAILKMRKNGSWMVQEAVEASEVEMFDKEELITVLIEKIVSKKESRKVYLTMIAIAIVITIPFIVYGVIVLGIGIRDDLSQYILGGIIIALFLPPACCVVDRNLKKIDRILYSTRANYIQILQKRMDAEENPYTKKGIVNRIERLKAQGTPYT
ncbi:MAG: hypothetical protein ACW98Y_01195 [Candidatus Thorarchaeota archaeon]|jgi:hypothetical protein